MGTLLFLFTSASAYNYFQFIYSERFLTFLIALYAYHYCIYLDSGQPNGRLALLFALFIPFFKDTAVLLAVAATTIAGSLGAMLSRPAWGSINPPNGWRPMRPGHRHRQPGAVLSGRLCDSQCTSQPCRRCAALRRTSGLFSAGTGHSSDRLAGLHRIAYG